MLLWESAVLDINACLLACLPACLGQLKISIRQGNSVQWFPGFSVANSWKLKYFAFVYWSQNTISLRLLEIALLSSNSFFINFPGPGPLACIILSPRLLLKVCSNFHWHSGPIISVVYSSIMFASIFFFNFASWVIQWHSTVPSKVVNLYH